MASLKEYLAAPAATAAPAADETAGIVERYPWYLPARAVHARTTGCAESRAAFMAPWRAPGSLHQAAVDGAALLQLTADDVIDRFLREEDLRIVADENAAEEEIRIEARLDDEDELVSEDLAEIYLAQGLRDEALAIYRKLILLNPEKSVYFAEIIEKIENNN